VPKLTVHRARRLLFEHHWREEPMLVLGRGEAADIPLPTEAASREHCRIIRAGTRYVVEALDAKNGLFINGKTRRIKSLEDGDRIEIADLLIVFHYGEDEKAREAAKQSGAARDVHRITADEVEQAISGSTEQAEAVVRAEIAAAGWTDAPTAEVGPERIAAIHADMREKRLAHLEVVLGGVHQRYTLSTQPRVLGFSDDCDIRLPGRGLLGKRVATIVSDEDGHKIVRLSNWASIKVGGEKLGQERHLLDGDLLDVAGAKVRYLAFAGVRD
jgi:hypothetical protein